MDNLVKFIRGKLVKYRRLKKINPNEAKYYDGKIDALEEILSSIHPENKA